MTPEKVLEVINLYRGYFEEQEVPKEKILTEEYDEYFYLDGSVFGKAQIEVLSHCYAMLDEMEQFVKDARMEKCFRWLGFIQGVLWVSGEFTLNELKNHSRPDGR